MFLAAFTSLSSTRPHDGHRCIRVDNSLGTVLPHRLHSCDVPEGFTLNTLLPASSALQQSMERKLFHPASEMLFAK